MQPIVILVVVFIAKTDLKFIRFFWYVTLFTKPNRCSKITDSPETLFSNNQEAKTDLKNSRLFSGMKYTSKTG